MTPNHHVSRCYLDFCREIVEDPDHSFPRRFYDGIPGPAYRVPFNTRRIEKAAIKYTMAYYSGTGTI
ncbi:MAG: hypothetical protein WCJ93_10560 [Methanomicrobiales archaeon]